MYLVTGKQNELPTGLYAELASYRYRVFVEQLGWQLQTIDHKEQDQFDRADSVYVVSCDEQGNIAGCGRLLPTTRPYLLKEVFPELLNGMPAPNSPDVWELSRFAAVDLDPKTQSPAGQFSSPVAVEFLQKTLTYVASQGVKRIITVSPLGVERMLKRAGFQVHRAGPPMIVGGHPIFACWIETGA